MNNAHSQMLLCKSWDWAMRKRIDNLYYPVQDSDLQLYDEDMGQDLDCDYG
jgi:hypothetical protein